MEYAAVRDVFFAPGPERPPSAAATDRSPARLLRDAIEPLACQSIWAPETDAGYRALGLDDFFAAYVWQRTAPLGRPPTALAVAALGVFAPGLVGPMYEKGSAAASGAAITQVRRDAPAATVRAVLGDIDGPAADAVAVLRRGIDAGDATARPIFAGLRAEPWPVDPVAALVHACHVLREHRGDSHLAACATAGLDPVEMNVLTELFCGYDLLSYTATRGWSPAEMDAAVDRLTTRGIVDEGGLTETGLTFRRGIEHRTDVMQHPLIAAIGSDLERITTLLDGWSDGLTAAGAAPPDPAKRLAG